MNKAIDVSAQQQTSPEECADQQASAQQPSEEVVATAEEIESSVKVGTFAQVVVAIIAVIGLVYLLKLVLVTTLASILLAYVLEPLVSKLKKIGVPRAVGSLTAVMLALALTSGLAYFSYNQAVNFADQLPAYSARVRDMLGRMPVKARQIEAQSRAALESEETGSRAVPVRVQEPTGLARLLSENTGTIMNVLLAISFVPFLVYFMLSWKEHFQHATVWLFPKEHRLQAHKTVGVISAMIRGYIVGNFVIGMLSAAIFMMTFGLLRIEYFYFLGLMSGFISLIPYLGLFLAMLPPLAAGAGVLDRTSIVAVIVVVTMVHVIALNVLYPVFVGGRLRLNPVVVTLSLLFWSWIWGALGLVLAIPILGSAKIICDHISSLRGVGAWLGESAAPDSA